MVTWCLNTDTLKYSRLSPFKESQNYKTKCKFLHMQFSSNEKPTFCIKTFLSLKQIMMHLQITLHTLSVFTPWLQTVCRVIITWKKYPDNSKIWGQYFQNSGDIRGKNMSEILIQN